VATRERPERLFPAAFAPLFRGSPPFGVDGGPRTDPNFTCFYQACCDLAGMLIGATARAACGLDERPSPSPRHGLRGPFRFPSHIKRPFHQDFTHLKIRRLKHRWTCVAGAVAASIRGTPVFRFKTTLFHSISVVSRAIEAFETLETP